MSFKMRFILLALVLLFSIDSAVAKPELKKSPSAKSLWTGRKGKIDGAVDIMDVDSARYIDSKNKSKLPLPSQKSLDQALSDITRIRIVDSGTEGGKALEGKVILDTSDPRIIHELRALLRIKEDPESFGHDMCLGGPCIEVYSKNNWKFCLGIQHGSSIRWVGWSDDTDLLKPKEFILWLASKGATGPKLEMERQIEQAKFDSPKSQQARLNQFIQTMPASMKVFFGAAKSLPGGPGNEVLMLDELFPKYKAIPKERRLSAAKAAIASQFPKTQDQIRALLEWSAAIDYPYAAAYRKFPTELLLEYEPSEILAVVKAAAKGSSAWVGASRLYSYMGFRDKFLYGYPELDAPLKQRILAELKATGKNKNDVQEFEEAISEWMYPIRREAILRERAKGNHSQFR
ncbi:MAG: hypothetical protein K2X27_11005 [Candidatus Obscuribacterales bacterium]|nr:hypothetical protein [Candidatus Obscuribacterales bacterium]